MIAESDSVYLREFTADDLPVMQKIYADNEVMKYIGLGGAVSERESERMIRAFMRSYEMNGFGIWACIEKATGNLIGHCGFNILPGGRDIEIAYLLDSRYWGKGIATSIASATLNYGFKMLKLNEIVALAYPENKASVRVIEKIGLTYEGEKEYFGRIFSFFRMTNPLLP